MKYKLIVACDNIMWSLIDHQQKMFHHMMDEVMYLEDDIDKLRELLIEALEEGRLTKDKINKLFGV